MTAAGERAAGGRLAALSGALRRLRARRWDAADAVVAAGVGLALIVLGSFAVLSWQAQGQALEAARGKAQQAADLVASQASWMLGGSLAALELIESKLAFEPAVLEPETKAELDAALKPLPAGAGLGLYDPAGAVLPNGGTPALPPDIAATSYFASLAAGADWTIAPQTRNATSGAPLIVVARRLGGDVFAGVAAIALDGAALHGFWTAQAPGTESSVALALADGRIIGRYPPLDVPPDLSASASWPQIAATPQGTYAAGDAPADGMAGFVGFRHLPALGVIAIAAVAPDALLAELWARLWTVLWLVGPLALVLVGGALLVARRLRRSGRAEVADVVTSAGEPPRASQRDVAQSLQTVTALLHLQPIPREIKTGMSQRLATMSAVHAQLSRAGDAGAVPLRDIVRALVETGRAGHDPAIEVVLQLDDLVVDRPVATPLGLIVSEAVANAFRHAFEDGRAGVLTVRLGRGADGRGQLTIEDNGVGFDPERPTRGSGRRLIGTFASRIGGEARFASQAGSGSRFTLRFPLAGAGTAR